VRKRFGICWPCLAFLPIADTGPKTLSDPTAAVLLCIGPQYSCVPVEFSVNIVWDTCADGRYTRPGHTDTSPSSASSTFST